MKTIKCTYLFADGHAVEIFDKRDKDAGYVTFVEIHEKFTNARLDFNGRLIIGNFATALTAILKRAISIRAVAPTLLHGSQATKDKGIEVGYLDVGIKEGSLHFYDMPGTMSGPYHYQPNEKEAFDPNTTWWGGYYVSKMHLAKAKSQTSQAA